ncbi:unnamed protein product [Lampetra planeri]
MPPAVCPTRDPEENPGLPSRYLPIAAATGENERLEGSEEQLTGQGARAKVGSEIQPKTQPRQPAEGGPGWSHQVGAIQKFSSGSGELCTFVHQIETAARAMKLTEEQTLTMLPTVLDDPALAVFDQFCLQKEDPCRTSTRRWWRCSTLRPGRARS